MEKAGESVMIIYSNAPSFSFLSQERAAAQALHMKATRAKDIEEKVRFSRMQVRADMDI